MEDSHFRLSITGKKGPFPQSHEAIGPLRTGIMLDPVPVQPIASLPSKHHAEEPKGVRLATCYSCFELLGFKV